MEILAFFQFTEDCPWTDRQKSRIVSRMLEAGIVCVNEEFLPVDDDDGDGCVEVDPADEIAFDLAHPDNDFDQDVPDSAKRMLSKQKYTAEKKN